MTHTNGTRLERWLGAEAVENVSRAMRNWYGPPIALAGVPGRVYAARGGDFIGRIDGGAFAGFLDFAEERGRKLRRIATRFHNALMRAAHGQKLYMGFSSLSDLISEGTVRGKRWHFPFQKVGTAGTSSFTSSLWRVGNVPPAGGSGSAAPGGRAPTSATTGAFPYTNPPSPDTLHLTIANVSASVIANTLLLYDRIFDVDKTMSSTATEAVTGNPTRYTGTSQDGADNSSEGNFLFVEVTSALSATAHNWTVCLFAGEDGFGGPTLPPLTGNASQAANLLDHPPSQWFAPLNEAGLRFTGISALDQMQCSASITGGINFVIGHPLAIYPLQVANQGFIYDGINSSFNLIRIFDDAALAFLEINKPSATATTYQGSFEAVAG